MAKGCSGTADWTQVISSDWSALPFSFEPGKSLVTCSPSPATWEVVAFVALLCCSFVGLSAPYPVAKAIFSCALAGLHQKSGRNFKVGPPIHAARSTPSVQSSLSRLLTVDAATHASVAPGPNPIQEGSIALLFGTDDEEEHVQEDSVGEEQVEDIAGTNGEDDNMGGPDDEEDSSPPTKKARHLCQQPKISFIFDETTGDFVESHPTIFIPRLVASPVPNPDLRRSVRSCASPINPDAGYLKTLFGAKSDATKKKKKDLKGKDQSSSTVLPHKCARTDEDTTQMKEKPVPKKPKLKETVVIDDNEHDYQGGVSGGGFGEKVPSSAKVVRNGIESIGVLVVDKDFGNFVEVDKSYWSKEVAPFVGDIPPPVTILPCKVNGVPALNPIEHYRLKGYDAVNTFEATVNAIEANNTAISAITQQFLAGLKVITHTNSICAQASHLRRCLNPIEEEEDDNNGDGEEDEAPDNIAKGVAGPSKKRKHK
ncbi:hypothetical protein EDD85DRAFT_959076 [Armillaria nabsnona]|nr:hypothetical protein EDD85DRAFT_959076 [Armillaria nabsnona]